MLPCCSFESDHQEAMICSLWQQTQKLGKKQQEKGIDTHESYILYSCININVLVVDVLVVVGVSNVERKLNVECFGLSRRVKGLFDYRL